MYLFLYWVWDVPHSGNQFFLHQRGVPVMKESCNTIYNHANNVSLQVKCFSMAVCREKRTKETLQLNFVNITSNLVQNGEYNYQMLQKIWHYWPIMVKIFKFWQSTINVLAIWCLMIDLIATVQNPLVQNF